MICALCRAELPDSSQYCLYCGAEQAAEEWRPAPDRRQVAYLLSQARFCVNRQDWGQADAFCRQAIGLDPHHGSAYSLLGDISMALGNEQEAAQWYDIALSLRPHPEDQQKLARLHHLRKQEESPEQSEHQYGSRSWVRVAIYAAATLCLILVLSALWILATSRRSSVSRGLLSVVTRAGVDAGRCTWSPTPPPYPSS